MTDPSTRILVVDDDIRLREYLQRYLTQQGFSARAVPDSANMDKWLAREYYDLVVLDLVLPREDGLSVCRRLRANNNTTPIIMLTCKGDEVDRIIGLEFGADDYLPKPFSPRELVARINAVLRRGSPTPPVIQEEVIHFGPFKLDLGMRTLTKEDEPVELTSGEFAILKVLATHAGQALSRDRLMILARGRDHDAFERSIDVQVSRLRRLIESDPGKPRYLRTVWGLGYVFVRESEHPP